MKRIIVEIISAVTVLAGIIPLCGCSNAGETYSPGYYGETSDIEDDGTYEAEPSAPPNSAEALKPTAASAKDEHLSEAAQTSDIIPQPKICSEINGGSHIFTVENVYSQGSYYTVSVTGEKQGNTFGNIRLVLSKDSAEPDILEISVPDGDRFLILDSVAEGLSYGCGIISNMRDFSAEDYPDIIRLDFYREKELEIPQYGRYFAIFDDKLAELAVYRNGVETPPLGTHLELRSEGRMIQHLCVYTPSGKSLMVEKYEYIFDLEKRRLNKRKVDFLGWNVDN